MDGLMRPMDHQDRPYLAADASEVASVPLPRTPPRFDAVPQSEAPGDMDPVRQARVRESATRNDAAAEMYEAGQYDQAVSLFEQALASCRSTLGDEHPETLTVAGNLSVAHISAGHRRKGIKLITNNVSARMRFLGDDHPMTLTARDALAAAYRVNGDPDTAVTLSKQVVIQRTHLLGSTHGDTLRSRMGLVLALAAAGDVNSANRILAGTMNDAEQVLGPEHPLTLDLLDCGVSNGLLHQDS